MPVGVVHSRVRTVSADESGQVKRTRPTCLT